MEAAIDRLHGILVFLSVVETRRFSESARGLGVSPAATSAAIARLESKFGVQLLNRTTRSVTPTPEGLEFYHRCKQIVAELAQAEAILSRSAGAPSGRLLVAMPAALGKQLVIPQLRRFCELYPGIAVEIVVDDYVARSRHDGFDAVVQVGDLPATSMIMRKLATVGYVVCAAPGYLRERGVPETPSDLAAHRCLAYRRPRNGQLRKWRFAGGDGVEELAIEGTLTFNSGEALVCAAASGLGVTQVARYYAATLLRTGELVELLAGFTAPGYDVTVVFQNRRRMPARLRVFIDFLSALFEQPEWSG